MCRGELHPPLHMQHFRIRSSAAADDPRVEFIFQIFIYRISYIFNPNVLGLYEVGEIYNRTILLAPSQIYKKDFKFYLKTPIS